MFCVIPMLKNLFNQQNAILSRMVHISAYNCAARKGTREKARKKKVKIEIKKVGFIPHNQRNKDRIDLTKSNKHVDDSWKAVSKDNVYINKYYRWKVYSVQEAINCHRETHHPTMYNVQHAALNVEVEINMQGEKATRFVDNFHRIAMVPNKFHHGEERKIMVFTKEDNLVKESLLAGAALAGGLDLIKDIQNGELQLTDYDYFIAHPNILAELVVIRGLLKKKFPNPKSDTLGANLSELVTKFCSGVKYSAVKDENQQDFGLVSTSIGTLDMDNKQLEENLVSLLNDIDAVRPKRPGKFITRVLLKSPPSGEQLKIDPFCYIAEEYAKRDSKKLAEHGMKLAEAAGTV